jgi:hypothetical protein
MAKNGKIVVVKKKVNEERANKRQGMNKVRLLRKWD